MNSKKLWQTVNEACSKNNEYVEIKEIKTSNNQITTDPLRIANTFLEHYTGLGKKLASKIRPGKI